MKFRKAEKSLVTVPIAVTEDKDKNFEVISVDPYTLDDLLRRSKEIEKASTDYMVKNANSQNVRFNDNAGLTFINESGDVCNSGISRFALGQLSSKIGVPARYIEKCVSSGRIELAQDNVNSWLKDYNKDLFLRDYKGDIRGVLSSRYSVCDSHEILGVVKDTINTDDYRIKGSFLNEERLHARLISKEMLPIEGEDLFAGIFIDSSDVGRSILTVRFGIYKQVCTNGLVVSRAGGVLFQQKHIGITSDEFRNGLVASLKNVDILTENATEWINLAKSKNAWGYKVDKLTQKEMEDFITRIRNTVNISEQSATKVIDLMKTKYGGSHWGLINGLTEVAQDYTLERRLDIERIAGNLLVA